MTVLRFIAALLFLVGTLPSAYAQVVTPMELSDPASQRLQQRYLKALMDVGNQAGAHKFPYPFYFSRVLDVDLDKQKQLDQRSIRFDIRNGQTVLEITGNYYASYSAEKMDSYERVKRTFNDVIMPLLMAAVPHFPDDTAFGGFAIEVSHHVREKLMGLSPEHAENVTIILPVAAAQNWSTPGPMTSGRSPPCSRQKYSQRPAIFLVADGRHPSEEWKESNTPRPATKGPVVEFASLSLPVGAPAASPVAQTLMKSSAMPMRIFTPESLAKLQLQNQDEIARMTKDLDQQAHFLAYAPPGFVGFRQGAYLQVSITTRLNPPAGASRYKLAALGFRRAHRSPGASGAGLLSAGSRLRRHRLQQLGSASRRRRFGGGRSSSLPHVCAASPSPTIAPGQILLCTGEPCSSTV